MPQRIQLGLSRAIDGTASDGCAEVWLACRHTWGWNNGDLRTTGWSNADFAQKRKTDKSYQSAAKTWQEQRSFVPNAVDALGSGKLQSAILAEGFPLP